MGEQDVPRSWKVHAAVILKCPSSKSKMWDSDNKD